MTAEIFFGAYDAEALAVLAVIIGIGTGIFWMVVGWRAMKAHERLADSHEALSKIANFPGAKYGQPGDTAPSSRLESRQVPLSTPESPRIPGPDQY
jgi:hypothetical protein